LTVDPRRTSEINVKSAVHLALAERQLELNEDPTEMLADARSAAERALEIDPENATGRRLRGNSYTLAVEWWSRESEEADIDRVAEWTEEAVKSLLGAVELAPGKAACQLDLGRALVRRAEFLASRNEDARQDLGRAREALAKASELSPELTDAHLEATRCWLMTARQETLYGGNPLPGYGRAIESAARVLESRPGHFDANHWLGLAHLGRAEYSIVRGQSAAADLASATEAFQQSLAIDPDFARAEQPLARAASLLAEQQLTAGADPTETLILGRAAAERAARQWPDDASIQRSLAALLLISAESSPHRNQRFWWGERAVDLLSRLPEDVRDPSYEDHLARARKVVGSESGP
jgi:tetratricopeptide (TPR) repeat protein